jgi:hypothetical protein
MDFLCCKRMQHLSKLVTQWLHRLTYLAKKQKGNPINSAKSLISLVRLAGIEPATLGFGGHTAEPWGAALLLQLPDFIEYSNRQ